MYFVTRTTWKFYTSIESFAFPVVLQCTVGQKVSTNAPYLISHSTDVSQSSINFAFLAMGFGRRSCAVIGCPNSGKRLNKWSSSLWEIHECFHCKSPCNCEPPFRLFAVPTEHRNKDACTRWTKAINRQNRQECVANILCLVNQPKIILTQNWTWGTKLH